MSGPAPSARDSILDRATSATRWATSVLGGVVVVVMMVYIVVNALTRTFFNYSLPASLEIVQFLLMPGLVSVGFVAATLANRHVTADLLYGWFPPLGRKWVVAGGLMLSALTLAVLVRFSWEHAVYAFERRFKAGYTDVPSWPLYFFVPVTLGLSVLLMTGRAVIAAMRPAEYYAEPSRHDGSEPEDLVRREIA